MQIVQLDLTQRNLPAAIQTKQGDVGRKFKAVILDSGVPYQIPADAVISVWYNGSGGEGNYTVIGDRPAAVVSGNTAVVELIPQMLACSGGGNLCLILNDPQGNQLGMWNILYICEAVPGYDSPAATKYFSAMSEIAKKLLDNQAPTGFGWGHEISGDTTLISDLNDSTLVTGYYKCNGDTENAPAGFTEGALYVMCWECDDLIQQFLTDKYMTDFYMRRFWEGKWEPWQSMTPALEDKTLYCTPERWDGLPVYIYRMHMDALPEFGFKVYEMGLSEYLPREITVVDQKAVVTIDDMQYVNPSVISGGKFVHYFVKNSFDLNIAVVTGFDGRTASADVTIKFTVQ